MISSSDKFIDGREVESRIEELELDLESMNGRLEEANIALQEAEGAEEPDFEEIENLRRDVYNIYNEIEGWEDREELDELRSLQSQAEGYGDWPNCTLIRESEWVDYAKELCEDIGDVPRNLPSYIAIDWEQTADNLRVDYTEVTFDGTSYLMRSC